MKSSERTFVRLWNRFDELAAMTDADRRSAYGAEGLRFLAQLMAKTLRHYDDPGIASAQAFSDFIVTLRADYREWNQYLMSLMIRHDSLKDADSRARLDEMAARCHWIALAEAARNFQA